MEHKQETITVRLKLLALFLALIIINSNIVYALSVQNVQVTAFPTSARISFTTDVPASVSLNLTRPGTPRSFSNPLFSTQHEFMIPSLMPLTEYAYTIKATDQAGHLLDDGSRTFRTINPSEIFFDIDAPHISNGAPFDVTITTQPYTNILVYVDGSLRETSIADAQGIAIINDISPSFDREQSTILFMYTIGSVTYNATQRIRVDPYPPEFVLEPLPTIARNGVLTVSGNVSENVTVTLQSYHRGTQITHVEAEQQVPTSGQFTLNAGLADGQYDMTLSLVDLAGNRVDRQFTVLSDSKAPKILSTNLAAISPAYTRDVTVRGKVDEPGVLVRIFVNRNENSNSGRGGLDICNDGVDNDGDGRIDYLEDQGCASLDDLDETDNRAVPTECNDGIDNDGDNLADYLDDPGCDSLDDDHEDDYTGDSQCSDGVDNDNDGTIDFLRDRGCNSASDRSENSDEANPGSVFTTRADSNGNFAKEILLSNFFDEQSIRITTGQGVQTDGFEEERNNNPTGAGISYNNREADNIITIVAIDSVGNSDEVEGTVKYGSCSTPGDFGLTVGEIIPAKILPDHVFAGVGSIAFTVTLDYFGASQTWPQISNIAIKRQKLSSEENEDMVPEAMFDSSSCIAQPGSGQIAGTYVFCNLKKWPSSTVNQTAKYKKLEDMEFVNFPLQFILTYNEVDPFTGNLTAKTQKVCQDVNVFVDRRLPPDKIPEGLLNSSVKVLDDSISALDAVIKPLGTINLATTGVCLGSYVYSFFQNTQEKLACLNPTYKMKLKDAQRIEMVLRGAPDGQEAAKVQEFINGLPAGDELKEATYAPCMEAIQSRLRADRFNSLVCDRIFCPVVPSGQFYVNEMIGNRNFASGLNKVSACAENSIYRTGSADTGAVGIRSGTDYLFNAQEGCGKEYHDEWQSGCLGVDVVYESNILADPDPDGTIEAQGNGRSLFQILNTLDFCKESETANQERIISTRGNSYKYDADAGRYSLVEPKVTTNINDDGTYGTGSTTADIYDAESLNLTSKSYAGIDGAHYSDYVQTVDRRVTFVGEYEDANGQQRYLTYEPNGADTTYYSMPGRSGKNEQIHATAHTVNGKTVLVDNTGRMYNTETRDGKLVGTTQIQTQTVCKNPDQNNDGAPYRPCNPGEQGIVGPQELGQKQGDKNLIDPGSSFINSLQCVCLPAIEGYLSQIRAILDAIRTCFKGILVSGEFNPGLCKAILTQYLCDWIYEAIQCTVGAIGGKDSTNTLETKEEGIERGFSALRSAGQSVKARAMERYGNTGTFKALFSERKLLHAVCLAAFGYDWVPDLQGAISVQGGGFKINSSAGIPVATRRFMGAGPYDDNRATYIYHVGYYLFAGSDLNWRLELVCSNDNSCDYPESNGMCDCAWGNAGNEQSYVVTPGTSGVINPQQINRIPVSPGGYVSGSAYNPYQPYTSGQARALRAGSLQGGGSVDGGNTEIYQRVTDDIRYDKVRLSWVSVKTDASDANRNGVVETKISSIGEPPSTVCSFKPLLLKFSCGTVTENRFGDIFFGSNNALSTDKGEYNVGDTIRVASDIKVSFPDGLDPEEWVPKYATIQFFDKATNREISTPIYTHDLLSTGVPGISNNGTTTVSINNQILLPKGGFKVTSKNMPTVGASVQSISFTGAARYGTNGTQTQTLPTTSDVSGSLVARKSGVFIYVDTTNNQCFYVFDSSSANLYNAQSIKHRYDELSAPSATQTNSSYEYQDFGTCRFTPNTQGSTVGTITEIRSQQVGTSTTPPTTNSGLSVAITGQVENMENGRFGMKLIVNSQGTTECKDGRTKWYAKVTLHDSNFQSLDDHPTYRDPPGPSPFIFVYQGKEQSQSIDISIKCN